MNKIILALVAMVALAGPALAQTNPGGERFCRQYASNVAKVAKNAIAQNSACFDPSKGMHSSFQSHYDWCMKTPRDEVKGAAANIRRLAKQCAPGANAGKQQGADRFCKQYATNASEVAKNAIAQNSACFDPSKGMHSSFQSHFDWCMKTPRDEVKGAAANIRRLARQCTSQGRNTPQKPAKPTTVPVVNTPSPAPSTAPFAGQITGQKISASEWEVGGFRFQGRGPINRNGQCEVVWQNRTIFSGACIIEARGAPGSFEIFGPKIHGKVYAYRQGEGDGSDGLGAVSANSSPFLATGALYRNGTCWENKTNKICAR